jgi:hypothetical protein
MSKLAIYQGRECVGFVQQVSAQKFTVTAADGRKLGSVSDKATAVAALSLAAEQPLPVPAAPQPKAPK